MKSGYKDDKDAGEATLKGYAQKMADSFSVGAKTLPALKDWKVGETYKIVLTVKQTGLHDSSYSDDMRGDFEIVKAEPEEAEKSTEKSDG